MSFRGSVRYCCLATLRPRIKLGARFEHATTFSAVFEKVHSISCDENWPKLLLQVVHGTQQPLELAPAEHEDFDLCGRAQNCADQLGGELITAESFRHAHSGVPGEVQDNGKTSEK